MPGGRMRETETRSPASIRTKSYWGKRVVITVRRLSSCLRSPVAEGLMAPALPTGAPCDGDWVALPHPNMMRESASVSARAMGGMPGCVCKEPDLFRVCLTCLMAQFTPVRSVAPIYTMVPSGFFYANGLRLRLQES